MENSFSERTQLKIVRYHAPGDVEKANATHSKAERQSRRLSGSKRAHPGFSKISKACILCRAKKTRCSGHRPCWRCAQRGLECQYMEIAASSRTEIAEDDKSPSTTSTVLSRIDQTHPLSEDIPDSRSIHHDSLQSGVIARFDDDVQDDPTQEDQYGHFHGSASGMAFLQFVKQQLASLPSISLNFSDYPMPETGKYHPILPPVHVAEQLTKHYFDFGLVTSRFVHPPSFYELLKNLYCGEDQSKLSQDESALVFMVLAMGSHYSAVENTFCGFSASVRFFEMAERELQGECTKITLPSVQARLLSIHFLINHSKMHDAWSRFGTIVRHAQALRLHRRSSKPNPNCIDHEYRKRLFWSIYIYDRLLSSIFGRPCAFHDDDIDQEECARANDEDISVNHCHIARPFDFCSATAMIYYARLSRTLGQILRQLYSPLSRQKSVAALQQVAQECEKSIESWQRDLPSYLDYVSLSSLALSQMVQRQMLTLKLTFTHTSLLIYRPFILYSICSKRSLSESEQTWIRHCYEKSVEAAKMTVAECRELSQRGFPNKSFWLVSYVQFAAIGTLYMHAFQRPAAAHERELAEGAMADFSTAAEGSLVNQRYLQLLEELRHITDGSSNGGSEDLGAGFFTSDADLSSFDPQLADIDDPWSNMFFDAALITDLNVT